MSTPTNNHWEKWERPLADPSRLDSSFIIRTNEIEIPASDHHLSVCCLTIVVDRLDEFPHRQHIQMYLHWQYRLRRWTKPLQLLCSVRSDSFVEYRSMSMGETFLLWFSHRSIYEWRTHEEFPVETVSSHCPHQSWGETLPRSFEERRSAEYRSEIIRRTDRSESIDQSYRLLLSEYRCQRLLLCFNPIPTNVSATRIQQPSAYSHCSRTENHSEKFRPPTVDDSSSYQSDRTDQEENLIAQSSMSNRDWRISGKNQREDAHVRADWTIKSSMNRFRLVSSVNILKNGRR